MDRPLCSLRQSHDALCCGSGSSVRDGDFLAQRERERDPAGRVRAREAGERTPRNQVFANTLGGSGSWGRHRQLALCLVRAASIFGRNAVARPPEPGGGAVKQPDSSFLCGWVDEKSIAPLTPASDPRNQTPISFKSGQLCSMPASHDIISRWGLPASTPSSNPRLRDQKFQSMTRCPQGQHC